MNLTFPRSNPWYLLLWFIIFSGSSFYPPQILAQTKQWDKTFGGFKNYYEDYWGTSSFETMVRTQDGGYLLAGNSDSDIYQDKTAERKGGNDFWLIKISENGTKIWDKSYGGYSNDGLETIVAAPGGGYLLGGFSYSYAGADKSQDSQGGSDYWIVKIDEKGNKVWDKTFGGLDEDVLKAIVPTSDGGYILGGYSRSGKSGDKSEPSRDNSENYLDISDFWLVKINSLGAKVWDKTIGGNGRDNFTSILATTDGGYLLGGASSSIVSGEKSQTFRGSFSNDDYWVVKTDGKGTKLWDKTFGGYNTDVLQSLVNTSDGSYLLGGTSDSDITADKTAGNKGFTDYWIVKINASGGKVWDKTFGGRSTDNLTTLISANGAYVLGGSSASGIGLDKTEANRGDDDYWLVKIGENGGKIWDKTFGGTTGDGGVFGTSYGDFLSAITTTTDGGYLIGGTSDSNAGSDKSEDSKGFTDFWIIKVKEEVQQATLTWGNAFGGSEADGLTSGVNTTDGGYLLGGHSLSPNSGDKTQNGWGGNDFWVVKSDASGRKIWDKRYGGTNHDYLNQVITTLDGGYLLGGSSLSNSGGDKGQNSRGGQDYWIVKISNTGTKQWERRFGGTGTDDLRKVIQLSTGEYLLAGFSDSPVGGDKSQASQGGRDYWIVKISAGGTKIWDKRYGGNLNDNLESFVQTADGGFLLAGTSNSVVSGDKTQASRGNNDYWVVRIDNKGQKLWDKRFGGSGDDQLFGAGRTVAGDFYLAGFSSSGISGDKSESNRGGKDFWMLKITANGVKLWDKRFGGSSDDELRAIISTSDGGFLLGGRSLSGISGDKSQNSQGSSDYWIVKTSNSGTKLWDKRYGGSAAEDLRTILTTPAGGYLIAGRSDSGISGDKSQPSQGGTDYWLVSLSYSGELPARRRTLEAQATIASRIATSVTETASDQLKLKAYPNPFAEKIVISFTLPESQEVSLKVYDNKGQAIGTLFQGQIKANQLYTREWQPHSTVAPGVYFIQLNARQPQQQKVILTR
ncbi:T9SS type A sorting domain-containing protein [Adhaeribacter radiodurans]|uniref:T9SS type A sorting domain-containing protein n=1 Tax=Adhaeribacter radiodurans TaxID=2745197 RepID=A0A7L7L355_9BACT|nr:T9SS type A sorting domain-containing protein [Adhaeribacter radiodurans]QMU27231.1 T9SS type A sorting domain-containing protein [Adhaeribacter radiodurans]